MVHFISRRKKLLAAVFCSIFCLLCASAVCSRRKADKPYLFQPPKIGAKEKIFPLYKRGGRFYIKAALNGDEKYWMIDTGSSVCFVDLKYIQNAKLEEAAKIKSYSAFSDSEVSVYKIPRLFVNNILIENVDAAGVNDLISESDFELGGILGANFFDQYVVKIDQDELTMTLYEPSEFKYAGTGQKKKFIYYNLTVHLKIKIDNRYEAIFMLDTGSRVSVFDYGYAKKNRFTEIDGPESQASGAWGSAAIKAIRFPKAEVGGFILDNVVFYYPEKDPVKGGLSSSGEGGVIGNNILENFVLYIDYPNKVLYFEKGKNFNRQLPAGRSGLAIKKNKDKLYEVIYISKKSAAEKAGLMIGDLILTINGKNPDAIGNKDDIYSALIDKDGTKIDLKIMRGLKELDIPLILSDPFKK